MANIPKSGNIYTEATTIGASFPPQTLTGSGQSWSYAVSGFDGSFTINNNFGTSGPALVPNHGDYIYDPTQAEQDEANACELSGGSASPRCRFVGGQWGIEVCGTITFTDERDPEDGGCGCDVPDDVCIFIPTSVDPCVNRSHSGDTLTSNICSVDKVLFSKSYSGFIDPPTYSLSASQPGPLTNPAGVVLNPGASPPGTTSISYTPAASQFQFQTPFTETVKIEANSSNPAGCNPVTFDINMQFNPPVHPDQSVTGICSINSEPIPQVGVSGGGTWTYALDPDPPQPNPAGLVVFESPGGSGNYAVSYSPTNPLLGQSSFSEHAFLIATPSEPGCVPIEFVLTLQFLAQFHPDNTFTGLDCDIDEQIISIEAPPVTTSPALNMNSPVYFLGGTVSGIPDLAVTTSGLITGTADPSLEGQTVNIPIVVVSDGCPAKNFIVTLTFTNFCAGFTIDLPNS